MDLLNHQDTFPEKKQLLYSLINYMKSNAFCSREIHFI